MVLDVLINSCARPDILDVSFNTFNKHIKTNHNLRYIILEDKVRNKERQQLGREWIEDHIDVFDKVVYAEKKLGPGKFFAPVVSLCESDYFFHLEDDNNFVKDVYIDQILDFMKGNENVVEVMMSRGKIRKRNAGDMVILNGLNLTEFKLFSVATGVFNTRHVKKIIDDLGWENKLHEFGTLTPKANDLGFKMYMLGHNDQHYVHVGQTKNYRKGSWKKL